MWRRVWRWRCVVERRDVCVRMEMKTRLSLTRLSLRLRVSIRLPNEPIIRQRNDGFLWAMVQRRSKSRRQRQELRLQRVRKEADATAEIVFEVVANSRTAFAAKVSIPSSPHPASLEIGTATNNGHIARVDVAYLIKRCTVSSPAGLTMTVGRPYHRGITPHGKANFSAIAAARK